MPHYGATSPRASISAHCHYFTSSLVIIVTEELEKIQKEEIVPFDLAHLQKYANESTHPNRWKPTTGDGKYRHTTFLLPRSKQSTLERLFFEGTIRKYLGACIVIDGIKEG